MLSELELERLRCDGTLLLSLISKTVKLKRKGKVHTGICPFHMEDTPSFSVYPDGHYHCFGCSAHGTVIDWVMFDQHLDFVKAVEFLAPGAAAPVARPARKTNGNGNGHHREPAFGERPAEKKPDTEEWHPIAPVPSDATEATEVQKSCDVLFEYRDIDDRLLGYIRRWEKSARRQRKELVPLTWGVLNGKKGWHARGLTSPKPLYGLPLLKLFPERQVIIAEGEIKADAINRMAHDEGLPLIGLSWMGGVNQAAHADLSPLKGRYVALWPDPDQPGRAAGALLTKLLKPICARITHVDVDGLGDDYDAAELEKSGGVLSRFLYARLQKPYASSYNSALELERKHFMPLKWIVPGFIPEGCTILAGKPKIGKSWFVLASGLAISSGTEMLEQQCPQRNVQYFALEDSERRLQERTRKIMPPPWPAHLGFHTRLVATDLTNAEEPIKLLEYYLQDNPHVDVLFVDTLARVQGPARKNEPPYLHDYRTVAAVADLARRTDTAIVLVHHVRKAESSEVFDAVLGTTGLTGAADTVIIMTKVENGIRCSLRGRDVEEADKLLDWDPDTGIWALLGDYEANPEASNTRQRILNELSHLKYPIKAKDLADKLGLPRVVVRKQLTRLAHAGKITKTSYGSYTS